MKCYIIELTKIKLVDMASSSNIIQQGHMDAINFNQTQTNDIIRLYTVNKTSCKEIGKQYNCSKQRINKVLRENNIPLRDTSHCQQKYQIDEHILDKLDTPEKAYWLGMLMGDGWVFHAQFGLSLQEKDKHLVYKFRDFLKSNHPINRVPNRNKKDGSPSISYDIRIWNKQLNTMLRTYGIAEDKTHTATFPKNIPDKFMSHYMRGLIDSDGCFTIKKGNKMHMNFISTVEFAQEFQRILMEKCDLNKTKLEERTKTNFIAIVNYGGNKQMLRVCKFLYSDASVYLERKRDRAIEHLKLRYPKDEWLLTMK
jgi:intein-encoded DNA endonuclease-like protein